MLLLLSAILYASESFFILFGIFLLITVVEFCNLIQFNKYIALFLALFLYIFFYKFPISRSIEQIGLTITLAVSIQCILFLFDYRKTKINTFLKYAFVIGYIILPFIFLTKIPFGIRGFNPKIIISIFILIWTNDTFAYIVGKSIGKNKLFERISPKKTIEGFLGGVIFAVLASLLISEYYIEGAKYIWIGIALIVSFFGTIGDLIESKFKRMAGVKDSGKIMPGHGGILDRLDSVIFAAPFVFLFYQILYYVS